MRRGARPAIAHQRTIPAPIGGLNFRDPISSLPETDALVLDNWFPSTSSITLRGGFVEHATGFPAAVETLMEYSGTDGRTLFAAAGTAIYDATADGPIGAASLSGMTNARWQHAHMTNSGDTFLVCVNGVDGVRTWDGSAWAEQVITGATAAEFVNVCVFSSRLWFTSNDSPTVFYLGTSAIAGAATAFDLGPQFQMGGSLAFASPISFSGGADIESMICFVSTNGEVLIYRGDPEATNGSGLVSRLRCGRPTGPRSFFRFGGDVIILTEYGVVSVLALTQVGIEKAPRASFSNKIDRLLAVERRLHGADFGVQVFDYPQGTMAVLNMPQDNGAFVQFAINTLTGAWCRFTGQNGSCWGLLAENLYFGGATAVYLADSGSSDNGNAIDGQVKGAFSRLGFDGTKRMTMMRPLLTANGTPNISIGVDTDYSDIEPPAVVLTASTDGLWDTGLWDVMLWGGSSTLREDWQCVSGIGVSVALRMKTSTIGMAISLHAVDVLFEPVLMAAL